MRRLGDGESGDLDLKWGGKWVSEILMSGPRVAKIEAVDCRVFDCGCDAESLFSSSNHKVGNQSK